MNATHTRRTVIGLAICAALAAPGGAGDIAPPAGPIAPTGKTLAEVEPRIALTQENTPGDLDSVFRITSPGSYYLTGNVTVGGGKWGIDVDADDVTIDLNGFTIMGTGSVAIGQTPLSGPAPQRVTVRNGRTHGTAHGIVLSGTTGARVESVSSSEHLGTAIEVAGRGWVSECRASSSGTGIVAGTDSRVMRCLALNNAGHGIIAHSGTAVTECSAHGNGIAAVNNFSGILAPGGSLDGLIQDCFVTGNEFGISAQGTRWTVVRNVATNNLFVDIDIDPSNHPGATVSDPALAGPWDNISN